MFQRELDLAARWGSEMLRHLEKAEASTRSRDVASAVHDLLDAAWRMESSLGQFLAVEEPKRTAAGLGNAAEAAARSFEALRSALADARLVHRRPEHEMKDWVASFRTAADAAVSGAREAQRLAPPAASHRISTPLGSAPAGSARSVVSIAQTQRRDLALDGVELLVREALDPIGGIERFVQRGVSVLLKPNQTYPALADEGATTDPRLVGAVARLCLQAGAREVIVGESSGGGSNTMEVMRVTGVEAMAVRVGARLVDFHICEQREVELPEGKIITKIELPAPLLDADVIVNLPKMKTHNWDWVSGALKNWVGVVRPDVRERHHDANTFDEYVDILTRVPPTLNLMDGIFRGVRNGPGATVGEFYGAVIASTDPVALDSVAAQLLGFDPAGIGFVRVAHERGLGTGDPGGIAVVGVPLEVAFRPGEPPVMGVDMYGANVIVGTGLTRAGTLGHFKSMADVFQASGTWDVIRRLRGRPTILIGYAEDPLFEEHLQEGPYVVIDDAAPSRYREHPEVHFVPGHPVLHNLETELLTGLKISTLGAVAQRTMAIARGVDARLEFGAPQPLAVVARRAIGATRRLPVWAQAGGVVVTAGILLLATGLEAARLTSRLRK